MACCRCRIQACTYVCKYSSIQTQTPRPVICRCSLQRRSVGIAHSLAQTTTTPAQCLHQRQRPTDDCYSSTTWPIHIPSSSSAHRAVRPLLRTRTSCPLHRLAAACSSVRAVVHKVCGECARDPPTRPAPGSAPAILNIQRQRACVDHPTRTAVPAIPVSSHTRPRHSRVTSPAPLYLPHTSILLADTPPIEFIPTRRTLLNSIYPRLSSHPTGTFPRTLACLHLHFRDSLD